MTRPAIHQRIGTWAVSRERMIARIATQVVGSRRPLQDLATREPTDPTIALLDATAVVVDVLAFYAERTAHEHRLSTATTRRALVELARGLGYEPGMGVASQGFLAFEVAPDEPTVPIPVGTRAMSLPDGADPPPQFETIEEIEASATFNQIPAMQFLPVSRWPVRTDVVRVEGVASRLQDGDVVMLIDHDDPGPPQTERFEFRRLREVETEDDRTRLVLDRRIGFKTGGSRVPGSQIADPTRSLFAFRDSASLFGHDAADWWSQTEDIQFAAWKKHYPSRTASQFSRPQDGGPGEWPGFSLSSDPAVSLGAIDLDREVRNLAPGSWVVLEAEAEVEAFRIRRIRPVTRSQFALNRRVHRIFLERDGASASKIQRMLKRFDRRGTTVHLQAERLHRAADPWTTHVQGRRIPVAGPLDEELVGRRVAVRGADADGIEQGIVARVVALEPELDDGRVDVTWVRLTEAVPRLLRDTVVVLGNVAEATHGQRMPAEVIGSGSAAEAFQQFRVQQRPITHVPDETAPRGARSTLGITVQDTEWTEVRTLADAQPRDRVFQTQQDQDGSTLVTFGDGIHGSRLPTGEGNVVAGLRMGIGRSGNVSMDAVSMLPVRPPGIRGVTNPVPFRGGADADDPENIRKAALEGVVAIDRLVALRDYELWAAGFNGVAKALAQPAWAGQRRLVFLTVAPFDGTSDEEAGTLLSRVREAVTVRKDPEHTVFVDLPIRVSFGLEAVVRVANDASWSTLKASLEQRLIAAFGYDARTFSQPVTASEVLRTMHEEPEVIAVDLDALFRRGTLRRYRDRLRTRPGFTDGVRVRRAPLLVLDPDLVTLDRGEP
ncbi:MAG: baseplate J/gp47 family protein [Myxococcota bacterium]